MGASGENRAGKILSAERVEKSDKLLKLSVDFGTKEQVEDGESEQDVRQVISGIGKYFESLEALIGNQYTFVTNLEPREIMGMKSEAMIIAVSTDSAIAFFDAPEIIPPGTLAK